MTRQVLEYRPTTLSRMHKLELGDQIRLCAQQTEEVL